MMSDSVSRGVPEQEELRQVHDSMLEGLAQLADYFGFGKVMGQLYGTLLLNGGALSLDDLMERLSISKASVSMNMRSLEMLGMVRQVWHRGSNGRRKYYEAEIDFWKIITNVISGREMRDVERAIHVMEENSAKLLKALPEMTDDDKVISQLYIQRMAQMQALFRFAQLVITQILHQAQQVDVTNISHIELE